MNSNLGAGDSDTENICALCQQSIVRGEGTKLTGIYLHFKCAGNLVQAMGTTPREPVGQRAAEHFPMSELRYGDHVALVYHDELQLQHAISEFFLGGLEHHRTNVIICSEGESPKYIAYMRESGIDMDAAMNAGDVVIVLNDQLLERSSNAIFDKLFLEIKALSEASRERGRRGVCLWEETTGLLMSRGRYKDSLLLERHWEEMISKSTGSEMPVIGICPFVFIPPRVDIALHEFHSHILAMSASLRLTKQSQKLG